MAAPSPHGWSELKKELMEKWHELTERDLERTRGESRSVIDLMSEKIGLKIEEASEKFEQMASRYHLYDEPEEQSKVIPSDEPEHLWELASKEPADRDMKPKDNFKD